ncbi:MAG: ATP-binding protein [Candidatus Binatia bacterium]
MKGSFFLWGPRQTGKTSLLRSTFPEAHYVDLLQSDAFIRYQTEPFRLREELLGRAGEGRAGGRVVIDEVQKAPLLLDEVHWLIENTDLTFALCGSSARKVRRGRANLLGGRALRLELRGLVARELGDDFDLLRLLNRGYLPRHYQGTDYRDAVRSYCSDYLKEEIAAEGLTRNLPAFAAFLSIAALSDTEQVEYATIARDTGVSPPTAKAYFDLLVDTLIASFLPAYRKRPKRRTVLSPKLYFFDVGVVNLLAKRGELEPGGELFGKAFENWVHHELRAYQAYRRRDWDLSYWKLSSGVEVDFVVNHMDCAIEAKSARRITSDHLKGLREARREFPRVRRRIVVCLEPARRLTADGILILPYARFVEELWKDGLGIG